MARMVTLSESVGLDGKNLPQDSKAVQQLLNENRNRIPGAREIRIDGVIGPRTIGLIWDFQVNVLKFIKPDGRVDPGGKTIKALNDGARAPTDGTHPDPHPAPMAAPALVKPICFPLRARPAADYHVPTSHKERHHRYFGAGRKTKKHTYRAHAACDLIAGPGTMVLAVDDGVVEYHEPGFFDITDAVSVRHASGLWVRYGEIKVAATFTRKGAPVKRGQVIGFVTLNSDETSMLHIEFYAGTMEGRLSVTGNDFHRRGDLVNPTGYLDGAAIESPRG